MSNYYIQTYSTNTYDFVENNPEDINILDIANALAQIPRFSGHLKRPLSVAQHCLTLVAMLGRGGCDKETQLKGLLHDAHEAYVGDDSSPYKKYLKDHHGIDMNEIHEPIIRAIGLKFEVDLFDMPRIVKVYDNHLKKLEAEALFDRIANNWTDHIDYDIDQKDVRINTVLGVKEAKELFVGTYKKLKN